MSYLIRAHPAVRYDLLILERWSLERSGRAAAQRRQSEIQAALAGLRALPHRGSLRDDIAPGLRAIPVGRRTVLAFVVDDDRREVRVLAVAHAGADWIGRVRERKGWAG